MRRVQFVSMIMLLVILGLLLIEECRQPLYMVPGAIVCTYILFNAYPWLARRMHQRKLTYEDLEVFEDANPELRKRFQIVFTRIQQIGGSICAGIIVAYAWSQYHSGTGTIYQTIGVLGGLISLYARIFGYIGGFCISCLYKLKRAERYSAENGTGNAYTPEHPNPNAIKPQNTENSNEVL